METAQRINQTVGVRQAFEAARAHVQAGRRGAAVEQLEAILEAAPDEVNSLCLLGSLRSVNGDHAGALDLLRKATVLAPEFADAALELARVQRLAGEPADAIETLQTLVRRQPGNSRAWQLLGDSLYETGDADQGRGAFRKAAETDPHRAEISKAINALSENRRGEGEQILRQVLTVEPNHVHALMGLASLAIDAGQIDDAEHLLEHARRLSPYSDTVWRNIARLHSEKADNDQAEQAALRAVELHPQSPDAWSMLGNIQAWGLKPEQAEDSFRQSISINADQPRVWMSLGHVRKTLGDRPGSETAYRKAISLSPELGEAYWSLADLKTYSFSEREQRSMHAVLALAKLPDTDRASLHFALGKANEDAGEFEAAFEAYAAGNAIKARLDPFDSATFTQTCEALETLFTASFAQQDMTMPDADAVQPVFVVGLPRSGSTLIEQILASHSQIQGTMELPYMLNYVRHMRTRGGYPEALEHMSPEAFQALGRRYLEDTAPYRGDARVFIDKMPNNFIHVGLISKCLPQAIIIDARRDPLDCCWSTFKQNFARGQTFSYDLDVLAQYYRDYLAIMAHWDDVLPGKVLTVRYEDVVNDTETQIRAMLDHCGLDFEPACLAFHETRRSVRTASAEQVRQPIYRRGIGQWRNFEPWLGRLIDALSVPQSGAGTVRS